MVGNLQPAGWAKVDQDQIDLISGQYSSMVEATLKDWSERPDCGGRLEPEVCASLGISSGAFFRPTGFADDLHRRLLSHAAGDPLLDVVPGSSLHFTFLALSPDIFATPEELPAALPILQTIFGETVQGLHYRLADLRLVPLPNCLLLAGIPDARSMEVRRCLVERLMGSPWRTYLEDRYRGYPIPPLIWHTTLARYRAQRFPIVLRDLYEDYRSDRIEVLDLGRPNLAVINYNWSVYTPL